MFRHFVENFSMSFPKYDIGYNQIISSVSTQTSPEGCRICKIGGVSQSN